ncbi:MAG: hypothetical protein O2895_04975 [Chloroflexi bacterium]|nr:hypothetical protein [Chloroflexota bacterium]
MYEDKVAPGGCRDTLLLTWISFQILGPALLALMGMMLFVTLMFVLLARHPLLALIPLLVLAAAIAALARWEQRHAPTMEDLEDRYRQGG